MGIVLLQCPTAKSLPRCCCRAAAAGGSDAGGGARAIMGQLAMGHVDLFAPGVVFAAM